MVLYPWVLDSVNLLGVVKEAWPEAFYCELIQRYAICCRNYLQLLFFCDRNYSEPLSYQMLRSCLYEDPHGPSNTGSRWIPEPIEVVEAALARKRASASESRGPFFVAPKPTPYPAVQT